MKLHELEDERDECFRFKTSWRKFLHHLGDGCIRRANKSLLEMHNSQDLQGKTFLYTGTGCGQIGVEAQLLGAKVPSPDHDSRLAACPHLMNKTSFANYSDLRICGYTLLGETYICPPCHLDTFYMNGVSLHTHYLRRHYENVDFINSFHDPAFRLSRFAGYADISGCNLSAFIKND